MLPGLRCLRQDMSQIAPEHEEVVASMIREYESKMEACRPADRLVTMVTVIREYESKMADRLVTMVTMIREYKSKMEACK
jgi:hypothetical protein